MGTDKQKEENNMTQEQARDLVNRLPYEQKSMLLDFLKGLEQDRQKESRPGATNTKAAKVGKAVA